MLQQGGSGNGAALFYALLSRRCSRRGNPLPSRRSSGKGCRYSWQRAAMFWTQPALVVQVAFGWGAGCSLSNSREGRCCWWQRSRGRGRGDGGKNSSCRSSAAPYTPAPLSKIAHAARAALRRVNRVWYRIWGCRGWQGGAVTSASAPPGSACSAMPWGAGVLGVAQDGALARPQLSCCFVCVPKITNNINNTLIIISYTPAPKTPQNQTGQGVQGSRGLHPPCTLVGQSSSASLAATAASTSLASSSSGTKYLLVKDGVSRSACNPCLSLLYNTFSWHSSLIAEGLTNTVTF